MAMRPLQTSRGGFNTPKLEQVIEVPKISVYRAGNGPFYICITRAPLSRTFHIQDGNPEVVRLVKVWPGTVGDIQAIRHALRPHHILGCWYAASPEVVELVEREGRALAAAPRTGGRRLTRDEVIEVYRAAHETPVAHELIGARYGVSRLSVGKIARGQVYPEIFERTAPEADGTYYVRERDNTLAPRYRFRLGKRVVK